MLDEVVQQLMKGFSQQKRKIIGSLVERVRASIMKNIWWG